MHGWSICVIYLLQTDSIIHSLLNSFNVRYMSLS
jgi:hypothetical protein